MVVELKQVFNVQRRAAKEKLNGKVVVIKKLDTFQHLKSGRDYQNIYN